MSSSIPSIIDASDSIPVPSSEMCISKPISAHHAHERKGDRTATPATGFFRIFAPSDEIEFSSGHLFFYSADSASGRKERRRDNSPVATRK